jgi:hypothetical protein
MDAAVVVMRRFSCRDARSSWRKRWSFSETTATHPPTTWGAVVQAYDPENRISSIHEQIRSLADDNNGLASSSIE